MQVNEQSCERIRTSYSDIEPLAVQSISSLGIRKNSRYETLFWFGLFFHLHIFFNKRAYEGRLFEEGQSQEMKVRNSTAVMNQMIKSATHGTSEGLGM